MTDELEKKLYEKYPEIFRQKDLPMTETCMCWGISCGDGWYELIDALCATLQNSVKNNHPQVEAEQVKEKFGGLRFYTRGDDKFQQGLIWMAETMSYHICEKCGTTKNVTTEGPGWVLTLCNNCREERNKE